MSDQNSKISRRELLKAAGIAGVGLTTSHLIDAHAAQRNPSKNATMIGVKFEPRDVVRLACMGLIIAGVVGLKFYSPPEQPTTTTPASAETSTTN